MQEFRSKLPIYAYTDSMIGGRPENQDDFALIDTPCGCLAVVCDGMGGGPGGKTASYLVKVAIVNTVLHAPANSDREKLLRLAIVNAQKSIEEKCHESPQLRGMGSTAVAVIVNGNSAVVAHVGDSRFYSFRENYMTFRTQDHSLVAELTAKKTLTEEEARNSSQSNIITRGLGGMKNHTPDIGVLSFKEGDRFVLCTDGVWGIMHKDDLYVRLTASMPLEQIVEKLQIEIDRLGLSKGGHHDNHTIIIMKLEFNSILHEGVTRKTRLFFILLIFLLFVSIILNICMACCQTNTEPMDEDIEMLKAYKVRYEAILKDNNTALAQATRELVAENDSLRDVIKSQSESIRVIQDKVSQKATTIDPNNSQGASSKKTGGTIPTLPISSEQTPKQVICDIYNGLDNMASIKCSSSSESVKKKQKIGMKLILLLEKLDKLTNYKYKDIVEATKFELRSENIYKVDQKDASGNYPSTIAAKKRINHIKDLLKKTQIL